MTVEFEFGSLTRGERDIYSVAGRFWLGIEDGRAEEMRGSGKCPI